jgi:hypothetical protein
MPLPRRALGCLIGVLVLTCTGTAWADDDDDKKPEVAGTAAEAISSSDAWLTGSVDPNGRTTTYWFEYGPSSAYGTPTASASTGDSRSAVAVAIPVTRLQPATTYHFRLVASNQKGITEGPPGTFTTLAASDPGPPPTGGPVEPAMGPELGKSVLAGAAQGQLLVRRPGRTSFEALEPGSELPMGTEVDASEGSLALTSALPSGATQTGRFGGGRFVLRQGKRGYLDLYLRGRFCSPPATAGVATAAARSKRRLWGRDHGGRFRTHGKNSHATVRGTRWVVTDSCSGTLTRVTDGSVVVTDKVRDKRVLLEAGERYLARPRR